MSSTEFYRVVPSFHTRTSRWCLFLRAFFCLFFFGSYLVLPSFLISCKWVRRAWKWWLPSFTEFYRVSIRRPTGGASLRVFFCFFFGSYLVLPSFIISSKWLRRPSEWWLPSFTEFYRVSIRRPTGGASLRVFFCFFFGSYLVLPSFIISSKWLRRPSEWWLPSFTEFCRVVPSFSATFPVPPGSIWWYRFGSLPSFT